MLSSGNDLLTSGNDLLSCGNNLITCENDLVFCGNDFANLWERDKNDKKTVLCTFLGSVILLVVACGLQKSLIPARKLIRSNHGCCPSIAILFNFLCIDLTVLLRFGNKSQYLKLYAQYCDVTLQREIILV